MLRHALVQPRSGAKAPINRPSEHPPDDCETSPQGAPDPRVGGKIFPRAAIQSRFTALLGSIVILVYALAWGREQTSRSRLRRIGRGPKPDWAAVSPPRRAAAVVIPSRSPFNQINEEIARESTSIRDDRPERPGASLRGGRPGPGWLRAGCRRPGGPRRRRTSAIPGGELPPQAPSTLDHLGPRWVRPSHRLPRWPRSKSTPATRSPANPSRRGEPRPQSKPAASSPVFCEWFSLTSMLATLD